MIDRASTAASLAIHLAVIALLAMVTVKASQDADSENGMEIEIVDFEYAMPSMTPVPPSPAEVQQSTVAVPSAQQVATPAPIEQQTTPISTRPIPPLPRPQLNQMAAAPVLAPSLGPGRLAPIVAVRPSGTVIDQAPTTTVTSSAVVPASSSRLDASALSRSIGSGESQPQRARINSAALGTAIGQASPRGVPGLTLRQRADLAEMVRSQVIPCWNPPAAEGAPAASVRLRFRLDRQGNLVGTPAVSGSTGGQSPYLTLLANSGRRAIVLCSPLELPGELYDAWSEVEVEFDPRDLR